MFCPIIVKPVGSRLESGVIWDHRLPRCLALLTVLAAPYHAKEFTAQVVRVLDGDSLTALHVGQDEDLRLTALTARKRANTMARKRRSSQGAGC